MPRMTGHLRGPVALAGQTVGLLGGSFDPPHGGHVHVTLAALRRFGLDRVWWLVSPGNPLKPRGPAPLAQRMAAARALMRHPRVAITDLEARLGTVHTAQTLAALRARYPGVRFVWLMGADNLAQVHRWQDWRSIFDTVPVGVIGRPGTGAAPMAPAARIYRASRLPGRAARLLPRSEPPAWCIAEGPLNPLSSTEIRARGGWG